MAFSSPSERDYYRTHGPEKHARARWLIGRLIAFAEHVPNSLCSCDEGHLCPAHVASAHYAGTNQPERLCRYIRLVTRWRDGR